MKPMHKYTAEFFGTACLVFCGTGAIVVNSLYNGVITHAGIALVFGFIVMAMIYAFGEISGAHLNPAVTVAFWVSGRFPALQVLPYILSQTLGAFAATVLLYALFPQSQTLGETIPSGSPWQSFWLEIILTFILMMVIMQVSTGSKETGTMAGLAIGSVVLIEALFAGPVTGASMNPARSLAPALIHNNMQHCWVYVSAPFFGAILGTLVCRMVKGKDCCSLSAKSL